MATSQLFERRSIAMPLARALIETLFDGIAAGLGERGEGRAFGEVLPYQAVGVLIGAPFPRMIGRREVELEPSALFDRRVAVEFSAIVGGHGLERRAMRPFEATDHLEHSFIECGR